MSVHKTTPTEKGTSGFINKPFVYGDFPHVHQSTIICPILHLLYSWQKRRYSRNCPYYFMHHNFSLSNGLFCKHSMIAPIFFIRVLFPHFTSAPTQLNSLKELSIFIVFNSLFPIFSLTNCSLQLSLSRSPMTTNPMIISQVSFYSTYW